MYTLDWLYTIYSRGFDFRVYRLIWDFFLLLGDFSLVQSGTAIFRYFEKEIAKKQGLVAGEEHSGLLRLTMNNFSVKKFVHRVMRFDVSDQEFAKLLKANMAKGRTR